MGDVSRYTFEVWNKGNLIHTHTLVLNPTDLTQNEPARVTVTNTFGGAHVDDFGLGVRSSNLKGTTGWRPKKLGNEMVSGVEAFKDLRNNVYRYFLEPNKGKRKDTSRIDYELKYFKWDTDEFYVIQPYDFQLQQSAREPLLFRFDLSFYMLREIGAPQGYAKSTILPPNSLSRLYSELSAAVNNMRLLMNDDKTASINMFSLDEGEVLSYQNYPEFFNMQIPNYQDTFSNGIVAVLYPIWQMADSLCHSILIQKELGYLDVSKSALDTQVQDFIIVVEATSKLKKVPFYMLTNMRTALNCMRQISNSGVIFRG